MRSGKNKHIFEMTQPIFILCLSGLRKGRNMTAFPFQTTTVQKDLSLKQNKFISVNYYYSITPIILQLQFTKLQTINLMQQLRSQGHQLTYWQNLYHHYRQYVQFLNDFTVGKPYTNILILLPNVVMIMDLTMHISHPGSGLEQQKADLEIQRFFLNISYLGISQAIVEIFKSMQILKYIILSMMAFFLLFPIFTVLQIFILTALQTNYKKEIGYFRRIYESSLLHTFNRIFIFSFQYVSMPVFTSVGIKLASENIQPNDQASIIIGITLLILVPLVYLVGQYHLLEIIDDDDCNQGQSFVLARINFPSNTLDCALIYVYSILINNLPGMAPFLAAIVIYLLRLLMASYFKYYQPKVLKEQYFTLISSLVTIVGLFIAYLCRQIYIVVLCIVVLLMLINSVKGRFNVQTRQDYQPVQSEEKTVKQLKRELWRMGTFTHVFRELVFQSRKNNSHREQLLIQILKVKCYELESKSRGGAKMTNTEDLLKFQSLSVTFLGNMLLIGDNSISILRLLQNKDPKKQIFAHEVKHLVNKINENKRIILMLRQINDISSQGLDLMKIMFKDFYNDLQFVEDMQRKSRMLITSLAQKQMKTRLFNKRTTAIFINILDEPGKIIQVSKNLPAVLGHSTIELIGKSINEIIPFTIQPFHDQILMQFAQKYSKKTMRSDPRVQFFAYTKNFHLQECVVRYYFVMSYFSSFQLCGVIRKIDGQYKDIILMSEDGVLEGWTQHLANFFGFEQFQMGECLKFNLMPLFPGLIKYSDFQGGSCVKTVFFRARIVKEKALQVIQFKDLKGQELQLKQLQAFKYLLQNDQLIEGYLADIQFQNIAFCEGKAKLKKIKIKSYEKIQNFSEIQDNIIKTLNGQPIQPKQQNQTEEKLMIKQSSISQYSMVGQQTKSKNKFLDSNFTLDFGNPNAFRKQQIRLQSYSKSQLSIELNTVSHLEQNLVNNQINANSAEQKGGESFIQTSFSPKLVTRMNFVPFLIFMALFFVGLITWDQVVFRDTQKLMNQECSNVVNRNRALMIYAKSSFNPNKTYIREFDNGRLMEVSSYLRSQDFDYVTYLGDTVVENRFYMFNIQIPSTLDRILMAPNGTRRAQYQKEILYNFNPIMHAWIKRFAQSKNYWSNTILDVKSDFTSRLIVISIGSIAFILFQIYIYMQYRKQKKMIQAFFKFQNTDLDEKMFNIRKVIKNVQKKVIQWHLEKQFYEIVKKEQITNLQFQIQAMPCQTKIKFQTSEQAEQKLANKKLYSVLVLIVIFLLTQILFIILYAVLNLQQVQKFSEIPEQLDKACKLFVLPNLMLANMLYEVPKEMLAQYKQILTQVLQKPLQNLPSLFDLFQDAPCVDCSFMYPLLTTNFRSFYSTFEQVVKEKTLASDHNLNELFYAVDVVTKRLAYALNLKSLIFLPVTVFLYVFSLTVFFLSIYFSVRKMIEENQKLQVFLKYFDQQILVNNKHMNGLFNKNI